MHEFDRCRFCFYHNPKSKRLDRCEYTKGCLYKKAFYLDPAKVIDMAKLYKISVTDVITLMHEVEK